jgi:acetyltransferase-like isoleucine patch superfamily enzyme
MSRYLEHDWFPEPLPHNVHIGANSWLYSSFAFLHCRAQRPDAVSIGEHTGIYNGSFFDLGPSARVRIGHYCSIVGAIMATNSELSIGDYTFIAHQVVIADQFAATPYGSVPWSREEGQAIVIGPNAWIGARAIILGGAQVGANAIVGAAAVVSGPVPDGAIVAGLPARIVGWT